MSNTYYGEFGGQFVSESLMNTLAELEKAFDEAIKDPKFIADYNYYLKEYVGRETPLYFAERLSEKYGTKIYLKREDLRYSKKLREILEIVDIESITSDKFDLLQPVDETEDTTM